MTSKPLVSRTLATLRRAEFGFFGVVVYTRVHTPRFCGFERSAGAFSFLITSRRLCRTSWLMVGMDGDRIAHTQRPGVDDTESRDRPGNVRETGGWIKGRGFAS